MVLCDVLPFYSESEVCSRFLPTSHCGELWHMATLVSFTRGWGNGIFNFPNFRVEEVKEKIFGE